MKKLALLLCCTFLALPLTAETPREIFQKNRPAVCRVNFFQNVPTQAQIGSYIKIEQDRVGIVVSPEGLILVNSDVYPLSLDIISGENSSFFSGEPSDFKIYLADGREYSAAFVGKDDLAQAAFLQITPKPDAPLPYVTFAPTDSLSVGDRIFVLELLGKNYDFQPVFSDYLLNAIIRKPRQKLLIANADVALSAGGLVLSQNGDAVGVTLRSSMTFDFHENMEFEDFGKQYLEVAPSEWLLPLIANPPRLNQSGERGKPWLGIAMQALTPELQTFWGIAESGGVVVIRVYPDSPADKAGLKPGDIIVKLGDEKITVQKPEELERFKQLVLQQPLNRPVTCDILRGGKLLTKKIALTTAPKALDVAQKAQLPDLGVEVRELTADVLFDFNLPLSTNGVYVYQVDRAAPAGLGKLQAGCIITEVNGQPVKDIADFRQKVADAKSSGGKKMMLKIRQRRETQFVFVDING
jgi:serine protease Do